MEEQELNYALKPAYPIANYSLAWRNLSQDQSQDGVQLFTQPTPDSGPCDITILLQHQGPSPSQGPYTLTCISSAKMTEVYSFTSPTSAPSYVCTLRGVLAEGELTTSLAGNTVSLLAVSYTVKDARERIMFRMRSLQGSPTTLALHSLQAQTIPQETSSKLNASSSCLQQVDSVVNLENPYQGLPPASSSGAAILGGTSNANTDAISPVSQLDDIRRMVEGLAQGDGLSGPEDDPKSSLIAAIARSALASPPPSVPVFQAVRQIPQPQPQDQAVLRANRDIQIKPTTTTITADASTYMGMQEMVLKRLDEQAGALARVEQQLAVVQREGAETKVLLQNILRKLDCLSAGT